MLVTLLGSKGYLVCPVFLPPQIKHTQSIITCYFQKEKHSLNMSVLNPIHFLLISAHFISF